MALSYTTEANPSPSPSPNPNPDPNPNPTLTKVALSYTIEASYAGPAAGPHVDTHFSTRQLCAQGELLRPLSRHTPCHTTPLITPHPSPRYTPYHPTRPYRATYPPLPCFTPYRANPPYQGELLGLSLLQLCDVATLRRTFDELLSR